MAKRKSAINPFYVLLVLFGLVFFVTACAYGVMAFRAVSHASHKGFGGSSISGGKMESTPAGPTISTEPSQLMEFLDQHGMELLGIELVLLALATFAAMGTDSYWTRRATVAANSEQTTAGRLSAEPEPDSRPS